MTYDVCVYKRYFLILNFEVSILELCKKRLVIKTSIEQQPNFYDIGYKKFDLRNIIHNNPILLEKAKLQTLIIKLTLDILICVDLELAVPMKNDVDAGGSSKCNSSPYALYEVLMLQET